VDDHRPGGEQMALQMAYFDRTREPVITDIGPVLDLEDAVGGKVAALASAATEAAAGQPPGRRDARQAEPEDPEIEP
jgi:hypothetical protein